MKFEELFYIYNELKIKVYNKNYKTNESITNIKADFKRISKEIINLTIDI